MSKIRSKTHMSKPSMSWWLNEGEEECPHCGQLYVLELEVRCVSCDGPSCPHCKVTLAEGRIICPECVESTHD